MKLEARGYSDGRAIDRFEPGTTLSGSRRGRASRQFRVDVAVVHFPPPVRFELHPERQPG